jgi:hypothetical protein
MRKRFFRTLLGRVAGEALMGVASGALVTWSKTAATLSRMGIEETRA